MYAKPESPPPFVVHMTYQYGDSSKFPYGKRQRMREARVWQVTLIPNLTPTPNQTLTLP